MVYFIPRNFGFLFIMMIGVLFFLGSRIVSGAKYYTTSTREHKELGHWIEVLVLRQHCFHRMICGGV